MRKSVFMKNIKPYNKYKPSGIAWLGDIPKHWEVIKLTGVCSFVRGNSTFKKDELLNKGTYVALQYGKTYKVNEVNENYTFYVNDEFYKDSQIVNFGDIIFISTSETIEDLGHSVFYNRSDLGLLGGEQILLKPHLNVVNEKYLYYSSRIFAKELKKYATGVKVYRFKVYDLKTIYTSVPRLLEQQKIALFLDYKLSKIDRFIRQKKQLIKLLNEQKAGIINTAVTKGLDPSVLTKPSGIEWLGEIPKHWEIVKLTGVCGFVRGNSSFRKDELLSEGKYVALQYGKTYKVNEVDEKYQFYVNDEFYKVSQIVHYGDVIFISTSETIEDLGHSVFYNRSDLGLLGGEQILLKPKNDIVNGRYLCYSSKIFAKELKKYATGVKVFRFNINDLKTIYAPVPPVREQQQIVAHIETETAIINQTIATIEKEITLVQEYKTVLIAEAVTGKIDVREYEIPTIEAEDPLEELEEELNIETEDEVIHNHQETA